MLRLGLDLGTNSIGWAFLKLDDDNNPSAIVDGGVLIHPDGRNPKDKSSNASKRRLHRGTRRNRDRMLKRRRNLANLLHDLHLLAPTSDEQFRLDQQNPLELRALALDQPLQAYKLGRVFMTLVNRRGFKSNRKADTGEDGKIRQEIGELKRRIAQSRSRTLGEYLWKRHKKGKPIRARLGNGLYPDRAMFIEEIQKIVESQKPHHQNLADEDWKDIENILVYQRPLLPVERGWCSLLPGEKRAYKAYPYFQTYRIINEVLNIEVALPGQGYRQLNRDEIFLVVEALKNSPKKSFDQIINLLKLPEETRVNLQTDARDSLDGDKTAAVLRSKKRLGKAKWQLLALEEQQALVERLIEEEDQDVLVKWLIEEFDVDADAAIAIASAPLPPGTAAFSKKALEKLIPVMEDQGLRYHDAVTEAGLGHHSNKLETEKFDFLPYYGQALPNQVIGANSKGTSEQDKFGKIGNPTVHIAMNQLRHLYNAICKKHGKPDEVIIELARDLKSTNDQKKRYMLENKRNKERNDRLKEDASKVLNGAEPTPHQMRKLRLWDEQGPISARVCPFSNTSLSIERVLGDSIEIEHILPFSRSLDDSMNNLVLASRDANREKGNNSPYERWGGSDPDKYAAILKRAQLLPLGKRWRFDPDAMERFESKNDFLSRQLNETRYLSRISREYLTTVLPQNKVWVTQGRMTAMLRRGWGLNSVLGDSNTKDRTDHRHHLVDAIAIGLTSRSLLNNIAKLSERIVDNEGGRIGSTINDPWDNFRNDVRKCLENCVVRHRQKTFKFSKNNTTGSLHNDTAYGIVEGPDENGMMILVERKPLNDLTPKRLEDVRDLTLRDKLLSLWRQMEEANPNHKDNWKKFCKEASTDRNIKTSKVRVLLKLNQSSLAYISRSKNSEIYKVYKTDGNAYMDIWLLPDGSIKGETISRYSAYQSVEQSPIKTAHPTARKLMRLNTNDTIATGEGDERQIYRIQVLSGQSIIAVLHNEGGNLRERERTKDTETKYVPLRTSARPFVTAGYRKVSIDYTGDIKDGGPIHL